jgi:hypothetical protein
MLLGFLSLCLFLVFPPLWYGVWFFAWIFLKYDMLMVEFFGGLEFALFQIDIWVYSSYIQAIYFVVLVFVICWYRLNKKST